MFFQESDNKEAKLKNSVDKSFFNQKWFFILGLLFLLLTWVEFRFFDFSQSLNDGIFFFGLVNFNLVLFLFLSFIIFRNIVRAFSERESGLTGKSLKAKMIAGFVGFSVIPTVLMFLVSFLYINNSFEKYFTPRVLAALENAQEITADYFISVKRRNYHFAHMIAQQIEKKAKNISQVRKILKSERERFKVSGLEFYENKEASLISSFDSLEKMIPIDENLKQKGLVERSNHSMIYHEKDRTLIKLIVPVNFRNENKAALVVSSVIPLTIVSKQDSIALAYSNIRDHDSLAYPIKTIYIIILLLITLVVLLFATWFGVHLGNQLSEPLERLSSAAKRIAKGKYIKVKASSGSPEITNLVADFNKMSADLEKSQSLLASAQRSLAWKEVAKRIAHEIKNPLTPIKLSAERLQKKFGDKIEDEAFAQCTSVIINQVDSMKSLINEFSLFARLPKAEPIKSDINKITKEVIALYDQKQRHFQISFDPELDIPEFLFDPHQIKRAIANLLDNSLAAAKINPVSLESKNKLVIEIYTRLLVYDKVDQQDKGEQKVQFIIQDNGVGVDADLYERIFEPYVTTKEKGRGLGLAIVRKTFEDHRGEIKAYRNDPQGLKFVAELPLILQNKEH